MMASLGAARPEDLTPHQLRKVVSPGKRLSYADLYDWLEPGQLLAEPPATWAPDWAAASADTFRIAVPSHREATS